MFKESLFRVYRVHSLGLRVQGFWVRVRLWVGVQGIRCRGGSSLGGTAGWLVTGRSLVRLCCGVTEQD